MTSKLRLKVGRIEVEFEGSEEFLKQDFVDFLGKVKELGLAVPGGGGGDEDDEKGDDGKPKKKLSATLSTSTIAATLGVDSGTELAIAALAKLCLVDGVEKVTRKALTAEMRGATSYFNENYNKNLTPSLKTLVTNKRVNDLGSNTYTLSATESETLGKRLADAK